MDLIESGVMLRRQLGDSLDTIKRLDPLPIERDRTRTLKRKLLDRHGPVCGYCGAHASVEAAHIFPLEIGSQTEQSNLILLCKQCHRGYDAGHLSINSMLATAKQWERRASSRFSHSPIRAQEVPAPTIIRPPRAVADVFDKLLELQRQRKFSKAVKLINRALSDAAINGAGRTYLQIKRAELMRRRSAQGVVKKALSYLNKIDPTIVPERYLPVFYYELSYVYRLLGEHTAATNAIGKSAQASLKISGKKRPGVDFVAAGANEILCEVAATDVLTKTRAKEIERRFSVLEAIAAEHGAYWGGRWALNCAAHILQVRMKADDSQGSWTGRKHVLKIYFDRDVSTGWDAGAYQTISQLEGLVHVLFPRNKADIDRGIGLLARAFVSRIGPRQRPEGIRDVGFGLAIGLRKSGMPDMAGLADAVEALMHKTVDGTSVLWPWRGCQ